MCNFIKNDASIIYYDSLPTFFDFQVPRDVLALVGMSGNNPSGNALRELWNRRDNIDHLLQQITPDISLTDDNINFDILKQLFQKFLEINGISIAYTTKILHKKRPNLIPIIDRKRVMDLYNFPKRNANRPEVVIDWIKHIRNDMQKNRERLQQLKIVAEDQVNQINGLNISFSLLRVFDILLWQRGRRSRIEG